MGHIKSNWNCLQPEYLSVPDTDMWRNIMTSYKHHWSVPHCVGLIDRKDVRVKKFKEPDPEILATGVTTESNI
jgi:hypothetical protein